MHTRISKIDLEMAEKIEVKDDNPNFNFFVPVKNNFSIKSAKALLRITNIIKVGVVSEKSGNLLTDGHKKF